MFHYFWENVILLSKESNTYGVSCYPDKSFTLLGEYHTPSIIKDSSTVTLSIKCFTLLGEYHTPSIIKDSSTVTLSIKCFTLLGECHTPSIIKDSST